MEQQLWLGTAKTDITPEHRVPLAGFSSRNEMGGFEGVAHPLHARIFLFRHVDAGQRETSALLVSADLIWWGSERIPQLKKQIREKWGIREEAVLFHGTHSHSGPQTSSRFSDYLGVHDAAYIEQLESAVLEGIGRAVGSQELVTVEYGTGRCDITVNRRKMVDGTVSYSANGEGPCDPELAVVRFGTADGRAKGILVHYACHPVVTQENLVSSEFCGVAMDRIEEQVGGDAVSAYLQGCCGDINPIGVDGELILAGSDEDVRRIGSELAEAALRALEGTLAPLESCPLTVETRTIMAPLQKLPTLAELEALTGESWVTGDWSRKLLASPERLQPEISLELVLFTVVRGLSLLAANSEIVVDYGLFVKGLCAGDGHVLPIGYTNGMIGYIPTAEQIHEGGYESYWSTPYFLLPAPFDPSIEQIVRIGIAELVQKAVRS